MVDQYGKVECYGCGGLFVSSSLTKYYRILRLHHLTLVFTNRNISISAYAYYANDEDDNQPGENGDLGTAVTTRKRRSLQPSSNGNGKADKAPNLRDRWRAQRQRLMKWLDN